MHERVVSALCVTPERAEYGAQIVTSKGIIYCERINILAEASAEQADL